MPLKFLKELRKRNEQVVILNEFEYDRVDFSFKDTPIIPTFVTILDEFKHHYSQQMMYYVRIESLGVVFNTPMVEYKTITRDELLNMWEQRKV